LVKRKDHVGYDEYISMVVAAPDKLDAMRWHPNGDRYVDLVPDYWDYWSGWINPEENYTNLEVILLGQADPHIGEGVIMAWESGLETRKVG
jgi:hypothetical protein